MKETRLTALLSNPSILIALQKSRPLAEVDKAITRLVATGDDLWGGKWERILTGTRTRRAGSGGTYFDGSAQREAGGEDEEGDDEG